MLIVDAELKRLRRQVEDPRWFIPRLRITQKNGALVPLTLRAEQEDLLDSLITNNRTLVLKSRQIGSTTLTIAFLFHRALTIGGTYDVLSTLHEQVACGRVNMMLKDYIRTMPGPLRPRVVKDNSQEIELALPNGRRASFRQVMAGGRGQGRGFNYRAAHFSEVGFYPKGSAATEGAAVDEDAYASIMSTMPTEIVDRDMRVVMESTANGPSGLFHKMVMGTSKSDAWSFRFYPWFDFVDYRLPVPPGFRPTEEEEDLIKQYGLSMGNIVFRRMKIVDEGYGLQRFRKEYPTTWLEPFLISGSMWFDQDRLNEQASRAKRPLSARTAGLRIYIEPKDGEVYGLGADPAGGTGNDNSVAIVTDSANRVCAVYSSDSASPSQFAEIIARLSLKYNRAKCIIESNRYGRAVYDRCRELGANLWTDSKNKPWWTDQRSKAKIYDWGRAIVNGNHCELYDAELIKELQQVREQRDGNIEADEGFHDDHPMALMLAFWLMRKHYAPQEAKVTLSQARSARHKELGLRRKDG